MLRKGVEEKGWNPKGGEKEKGENKMRVLLNGKMFFDSQTEEFFNRIDQNTYNSIGEAIESKIMDYIHHTDWYNYNPPVASDLKDLHEICGNNAACYMDNANWQIMNKTEVTADIYKFITQRVHVVKDGFSHNFWPWDHAQHILNFIDWNFVLDCVAWFF